MKINEWDRDLYNKAWDFASFHHSTQTYGGKEEGVKINYINHLGSVCMEVIWALEQSETIYDANLAISCALLHDILEDTPLSFEELVNNFGDKVANGVLALTKNEILDTKSKQMTDSLERIKLQPKEIWMVKMADRISNLKSPPFYWNEEKKINYKKEGQLILDELGTCNPILKTRLQTRINNYLVLE